MWAHAIGGSAALSWGDHPRKLSKGSWEVRGAEKAGHGGLLIKAGHNCDSDLIPQGTRGSQHGTHEGPGGGGT